MQEFTYKGHQVIIYGLGIEHVLTIDEILAAQQKGKIIS